MRDTLRKTGEGSECMHLHFEKWEYEQRIANTRAALSEKGLDALIVFSPESQYYLTGFDTTGYVFFQCLLVTAVNMPLVLLTRTPDVLQARATSIIEDVRVWYDAKDAQPADKLWEILEERQLAGGVVGVELNSFGLKAVEYEAIRARLGSWCDLVDGSAIVQRLRMVKSASELEYVRTAAQRADEALCAMIAVSGPGAFEGDIAAAGASTLFQGGCDPAPSGPVLGSGDRALLVRGTCNYRNLSPVDQVTMEFAASYRHYCCCLMRTIAIGASNALQRSMFSVAREALVAMTEAAQPGRAIGEIDEVHRDTFDRSGYRECRMAACGYSLGATFRPTWMDVPPMVYAGNPLVMVPGMVLFLHAILVDKKNELSMTLGHTVNITERGPKVLSDLPLEYITRR